MTAGPLPPPIREPVRSSPVASKSRRMIRSHDTRRSTIGGSGSPTRQAFEDGADEVICLTPERLICEASRANVFLVEGRRLSTPGLDGPLLPGIMRRVVLERATQIGLEIEEGSLPVGRLFSADEAFLTSSLRGILPIARLMEHELPAPGPLTRQLREGVLVWLESGG